MEYDVQYHAGQKISTSFLNCLVYFCLETKAAETCQIELMQASGLRHRAVQGGWHKQTQLFRTQKRFRKAFFRCTEND